MRGIRTDAGEPSEEELSSLRRIKKEIADFFAANPFLLVSEDWLASLLCRPVRLVEAAVRELMAESVLEKRQHYLALDSAEGRLAHFLAPHSAEEDRGGFPVQD
ncbi:MAG: hypothetical protein H5T72_06425 [Actinobacteria bacterium]|nr:hypothetical protein [Actinomycetota bacterium]